MRHSQEQESRGARLQRLARESPEWFFREILGIEPWRKQIEIAESVNSHEKTLVYSCVSSGKSYIGGGIIPWWLTSRHPSRVFVVAPTERQIKVNLWNELSQIHAASKLKLGGRLQTLDWKYAYQRTARGFSPKDAMAAFGFHGPNDLVIFDDAQGVRNEIFDALENVSAGGTAKFLYLCNPAVVSGFVYDAITHKRQEVHPIQIDAFSTPNVQAGKQIVPGLITKEKVDEWIKRYGYDSDFVRVKVRALPPKQEPDTLIPLDWLELAKSREVPQRQGPIILGVDVARFGNDESIIYVKDGRQLMPSPPEWMMHGNDTMEVAGRVFDAFRKCAEGAYVKPKINVDEIGVGGGVVDRLRELGANVRGVNVAQKPYDDKEFNNLRSEMWWAARDSLDPDNPNAMALPNDDALIADLSSVKYKLNSHGQKVVESKDDMKKRLGRSPDRGDAYCLAVFESYIHGVKPAAALPRPAGNTRRPAWK